MNGFRLGASVLGVAAVVIFAQPVYAQISAERVEEIAKEITVYLKVPGTSGSGVLIKQVQGENGDYVYTVLTAYHVVKDVRNDEEAYVTVRQGSKNERKYKLNTSANAIREWKLGDWDLAIAQFSSNEKYEVAAIGDSTKLSPNKEIYVAGFPKPSPTFPETYFQFKSGLVDAIPSQPTSEGYQLVYDNRTITGISGGAVLNKNGELVAIHIKGETTSNGKERNFGIPTALFRDQLVSLERKPRAVLDPPLLPEQQKIPLYNYSLATTYYNLGDKQGSIADLNKAIRLNPNYTLAYYSRGLAKYALGDQQGAIADFNEVIRLNATPSGSYYGVYNDRGLAKYALGDQQGAIADFNEAIRISPDYASPHYGRGLIKKKRGEQQEALADFRKASELFQIEGNTQWYNKSRDRIRELNLEPSPTRQGMKAEDYLARSLFERGLEKERKSDFRGAIADYSEAIRLNPKDANAYNNRGSAKLDLGDKQEAISDYNESILINPNFANPYNGRGNVKRALGDEQGAIADYNKAIQINPEYAEPYNNRGNAKDDLGDKQGAIADYNEAIRINPNLAAPYYNRGLIKKKRGEQQEALADFQKASELYQKQGNTEWYNNSLDRIRELGG